MKKLPQFIILLAISMCCFASTVKPDAEQPVAIKSDTASFDHSNGVALYNGDVKVDQGSRHLSSEKLTIYRDDDNKIKVIIATGNPARFKTQPDPSKPISYGKANLIKYYPQQEKVDLFGNAELIQKGDRVTGPMLSYNFKTEVLKSKSSKKQRATVILHPKVK